MLYGVFVFSFPCPLTLIFNLYLLATFLSLFLPTLTLNLCLPVLRFTVKVCYCYSVYLLICTYFLSIMWEISKLFEIFSQGILSIFLIDYNWSHSVHFHFVIQLLQLFYIDMMLICKKKLIKKNILRASWKFFTLNSSWFLFRATLV